MVRSIAIVGTLCAIGFLSGSVAMAQSPSETNGRLLYVKVGCDQCHGYEAQGAVSGPRLAPDPMPFDAMVNFVRESAREMPPYSEKILSNADLADIYAFLQSIS